MGKNGQSFVPLVGKIKKPIYIDKDKKVSSVNDWICSYAMFIKTKVWLEGTETIASYLDITSNCNSISLISSAIKIFSQLIVYK